MADQCESRRTSRRSFLKSLDESELLTGLVDVARGGEARSQSGTLVGEDSQTY